MIGAKSQAEKVADGSFDTGRLFAIPIDAQHNALEMIRLVVGDGEPDMGDRARAIGIQHCEGRARRNLAEISIGALGIGA